MPAIPHNLLSLESLMTDNIVSPSQCKLDEKCSHVHVDLSVLIITFNEELHLSRCIESVKNVTDKIFVVDSYSTDATMNICHQRNVSVVQRKFINHAEQLQWAIENNPFQTEWVMRIDADEYLDDGLKSALQSLQSVAPTINGFEIKRKQYFLGKWIKWGSVYPLHVLRIWRHGFGFIEKRWMDEHVVLKTGDSSSLEGNIVDENLNNIKWWSDKHIKYAEKEALEILNEKYLLFPKDESLLQSSVKSQAKIKRFIKGSIYNKLPVFVRPLLYFVYRYVLRLGFLDGKAGFAYHFFQGYWYRSLVDLRVYELDKRLKVLDGNEAKLAYLEEQTGLSLR